jgi:Arc/MetJ-type ribon-helix-helix transcriptional regulator
MTATVKLTLPDDAADRLQSVVSSGAYESADAYISELIALDLAEKERMRSIMVDSMQSGIAGDWTPGYGMRRFREVLAKAATTP